MAIKSIRHKGLRRLYVHGDSRGVHAAFVDKLRDMLHALDSATTIEEIETVPGWRLHPLKGDLRGVWSMSISGNWRYSLDDGDAFDLDLMTITTRTAPMPMNALSLPRRLRPPRGPEPPASVT
jgi:proteic killer suppression protein